MTLSKLYSLYLYLLATFYFTLCLAVIILLFSTYEYDKEINKGANTYITTIVANCFSIPFYFSQGLHYWTDAFHQLHNRHYIRQLITIFVNIIYIIVIMTCNGILLGAGYFYPHTFLQANVILGAYIVYCQLLFLLIQTVYDTIKRSQRYKKVYFPYHPFYINLDDEMDIENNVNILNSQN